MLSYTERLCVVECQMIETMTSISVIKQNICFFQFVLNFPTHCTSSQSNAPEKIVSNNREIVGCNISSKRTMLLAYFIYRLKSVQHKIVMAQTHAA